MKHLIGIIAALLMLSFPAQSPAHQTMPAQEPVQVSLLNQEGQPFHMIPHRDFQSAGIRIIKRYLEAVRGQNYGIDIRNTAPYRIGVVIAVDGRNIISGQRSDLTSREQMYVIDAFGSIRLDGWRTDSSTVHRFYFTASSDSYTVTTFHDTSAMGVIAVAVYREKQQPQSLQQRRSGESIPAPAGSERAVQDKAGAARLEDAGTGFGDPLHAPVIHVAFEPESRPLQKTLVKYEWRETLCAKGILTCRPDRGNRLWNEESYAPYPPGYSRRR